MGYFTFLCRFYPVISELSPLGRARIMDPSIRLVQVQGRTYRVYTHPSIPHSTEILLRSKETDFEKPLATPTTLPPAQCAAETLKVPVRYHRQVIGKRGHTLKRIEKDTNTHITVPRRDDQREVSEHIVIQGTLEDIAQAKVLIQTLVKQADQKPKPLTHFISLPFKGSSEFMTRLDTFRTLALNHYTQILTVPTTQSSSSDPAETNGGPVELNPQLYIRNTRLHLTLAVLSLCEDDELDKATATLQGCASQLCDLLGTQPLHIRLRNLRVMKGTPDKCKVLYAAVEDDSQGRLRELVQHILTEFKNAGLIQSDDYNSIKLHATLANVGFLPRPSRAAMQKEPLKSTGWQPTFDAGPLLEKFGGFDFGVGRVGQVEIARMGSVDPEDGSYVSVHSVDLT
ncbi:activating signal cointegrator 1 complex subunit [Dispira simplex]|nr:activating signal cointegrator 1 complex subunit [Dispira simplex]